MRILTVRQPWALHIIQSGKDVENRPRNIAGSYRGPVAIHSALKADEGALFRLPRLAPNGISRHFRYGFIIGVVDLVGAHPWTAADGVVEDVVNSAVDGIPRVTAGCSPWAFTDGWHLELENPRPLTEPIPYRGALGLRQLDDDTTARILAQIGA